MKTLITIGSKTQGNPPSVYTVNQLSRMARALVGKQGKVFAITVNFDERTGNSRLIAAYETAPNQQTFASCAI